MIRNIWLLLTFLSIVYSQNCSDYYSCQLKLYDQLIAKSRTSVRPIENNTQTINVRLGFSLIKLVSVNEEDSLLTIRAHVNQSWNATVLGWNADLFANVQHIRVPAHLVWTPKIDLVNPSTTIDSETNNFIDINASGRFELSYSTLLTIPCNFDLHNFPFDQQICTFKLGSSLYDASEVSITQAVDVVIDEPNLMPNGYYFVSHSTFRNSAFFAGFDRTYDQIGIQFTVHRRSSYFVSLLNVPGFVLVSLTLTLLFLPPSATERIIFGALLLVCQLNLLTLFAHYVPKRLGSTLPWMGRTILYDFILTATVLFFSVIVRFLASAGHYSAQRPSPKLRSFIFGCLAKIVGLKRTYYAILVANGDNDYESNDIPNSDSAMEPLTSVAKGSTSNADPLVSSSTTMSRDVGSIKNKINLLIHEQDVHKEWILLAEIINRLCSIVYLFLFSFAVVHHVFYY